MGRRSLLVAPGEAAPSRQTLGINVPSPVLAVIGTTTDLDTALDAQLLPAVLAAVDAVARSRAVFVTGGTDAGVFHLLRMAIAVASSSPAGVVGVAPDGLISTDDTPASPDRVDVDPGLTALVRVKGEQWGDETPMLSRVVTELAVPGRAAVLLLGGGDGARVEVREHLRQRRPIVVLGGSGRLADEIAAGIAGRDDEELGALLAGGDVRIVPLSAGPDALRDQLGAILRRRRRWRRRPARSRRGPVLLAVFPKLWFSAPSSAPLLPEEARREYAQLADRIEEADRYVLPAFVECDQLALREQNRWRWFTVLAITGGFLTTVFGAVQAWLQSALWPGVFVVTLGAASSALTTVARRQGSLHQFLSARLARRTAALAVLRARRPGRRAPMAVATCDSATSNAGSPRRTTARSPRERAKRAPSERTVDLRRGAERSLVHGRRSLPSRMRMSRWCTSERPG